MGKDTEYAVRSLLKRACRPIRDPDRLQDVSPTLRDTAEEMVAFFYSQCDCVVHLGKAYRIGSHEALLDAIMKNYKDSDEIELVMLRLGSS